VIAFRQVSFAYPGAETHRMALDAFDLEVQAGEMVALLGANGSGKSTAARLVNGLLLPSAGSVTVDDIDTADDGRSYDVRQRVGMVFQHPDDQIVATSVEDDVAFGPENLGLERAEIRRRVDEAIADVGLTGLESREPHLLSGGQKQRLAIAGALAMRPRYLVLDEPTSMIDSQGRREVAEVLDRVRRAGHGILLITHDVAEAARADRVVVISLGRAVFSGSAEQLLDCEERMSEWGLALPPIAVIARELRSRGRAVASSAMDPASVVEALCP